MFKCVGTILIGNCRLDDFVVVARLQILIKIMMKLQYQQIFI